MGLVLIRLFQLGVTAGEPVKIIVHVFKIIQHGGLLDQTVLSYMGQSQPRRDGVYQSCGDKQN